MTSPLLASVAVLACVTGASLVGCGGQAERNEHDLATSGGFGGKAEPAPGAGPASEKGGTGPSNGGTQARGGGGDGGGNVGEGGETVVANAGSPYGGAASVGGAGEGGEPPGINCDPISFEDPELEATVRAAIEKPSGALSAADVAGLAILTTPSISSLEGVECLTDLTSLDIGSLPASKVTDLRPLAPLLKLEELSLNRNPVTSLEPLGKLPQLALLFMSHIPVALDLAPLASAPKLDYLDIEADTIETLAPLGSVTTLHTLRFRNGHLGDPSGVAALKSVEDLDVGAVFSDASPLAGLTQLKKLRIGQKPLASFSSLKGLTSLLFLDVSSTGISDLSPVASMPKMVNLNASSNAIADLSPLEKLANLSIVNLVANQISDVAALVANPGLANGDFVYLGKNQLSCAGQAANIQTLEARGVSVQSDCP